MRALRIDSSAFMGGSKKGGAGGGPERTGTNANMGQKLSSMASGVDAARKAAAAGSQLNRANSGIGQSPVDARQNSNTAKAAAAAVVEQPSAAATQHASGLASFWRGQAKVNSVSGSELVW